MSNVSSYYHVVFSTYRRRMTIVEANKRQLYAYIFGIITSKKFNSKLIWMNGIANHIHLLISLHPATSLSDLIGAIKSRSNVWMRESGLFPDFDRWGAEYFAATLSHRDVPSVKAYIQSQESHHYHQRYEDEIWHLAEEVGITLYKDKDGEIVV